MTDYTMPEIDDLKEDADELLEKAEGFVERMYERAEQYRDSLREDGIDEPV